MRFQRTPKMKLHWVWLFVMVSLALGLTATSLKAEGTWVKKAGMPTPRLNPATSVVDGIIYAIGGQRGWGDALSVVEAYDPATNTWTRKANMPTPRSWFPTATVDGKIYAIGGWNGNRMVSTLHVYDPAADTWTRKADIPSQREVPGAAVVNGIIYVIGGHVGDGRATAAVEAYDPATDTWSKKADIPTARWSVAATPTVDGMIYCIGGQTAFNTATHTVESYNPATETWTKMPNMPAWAAPLTFYSRGNALVNGGIYMAYYSEALGTAGVASYNPAMELWTQEPNLPTIRRNLSLAVVNERIYAIGGAKLGSWDGLTTVEEFTPDVPDEVSAVSLSGKLATTWGQVRSQ